MARDNRKKKTYGLIGFPLVHSFSRDYFNHKFKAEDINAEYINFEIEDVGMLMELLAEHPELDGLNVTAPYKEQVIPYMNSMDPIAEQIGAVNVIKFLRDDSGELAGLRGYNSDVVGFGKSVEPLLTPQRTSALILGTGGAAKAVARALEDLGVETHFVSRRKSATTVTYEELTRAMVQHSKLIVNATPLGKYPNEDQTPDFPFRFLGSDHLCYDLIYNPSETRFMRESAACGAQTKNGLEMLLLQAFVSYEIWNRKGL